MTEAGPHPYFDDRRTIRWHARLADALAEARENGKRVFVAYGHPKCEGTRALIERTIWKEEIADFLNRNFISLAVDAGHAEPEIAALLPQLAKQAPTPLAIYLANDGRLLHSTAGGRPAAVLLQDMTEALRKK